MEYRGQGKKAGPSRAGVGKGPERVIPNPKLKLMDQVREVLAVNGKVVAATRDPLFGRPILNVEHRTSNIEHWTLTHQRRRQLRIGGIFVTSTQTAGGRRS